MTEHRELVTEQLIDAGQRPEDSGGGDMTKPMDIPSRKPDIEVNCKLINGDDGMNMNMNGSGCGSGHPNANMTSDSEEGFLSTSPADSTNGDINDGRTMADGKGKLIVNNHPSTTTLTSAQSVTSTTKTKISSSLPLPVPVKVPPPICLCTNPNNCVTLRNILDSFKAPLSEEQAWALMYQFMSMYRSVAASKAQYIFNDLEIPDKLENVNVHRDGSVHCSWSEAERKKKDQKIREEQQDSEQSKQHRQQQEEVEEDVDEEQQQQHHRHEERHNISNEDDRGYENHALLIAAHKKILRQVAVIIYTALDYNLQADEQCQMSEELEELITYMTAEAESSDDECIDEGIDEGYKRWDDDDNKFVETKEFDYVLEACRNHAKPTIPEDHYKAVCRALVTETIELRIFLHTVLHSSAENLHLQANSQASKLELAKLGFNDWARFWVQVLDELRQGVRLKKRNYIRAPIEYELTPYEILMEDIRSKKYQLRKVMVNGDIPPRVKKDAHALILEFIRSRPPLKKASERQLPPPIQRTPSPREQLMDSIRKGRTLKHIQPPTPRRLKDRLLPPPTAMASSALSSSSATSSSSAAAAAATTTSSSSSSMVALNKQTLDESLKLHDSLEPHTTPRSKQRLIKVDFSLLQDDENLFSPSSSSQSSMTMSTAVMGTSGVCSQPKMPPYPIGGYMVVNDNSTKATKPQPTATASSTAAPPASGGGGGILSLGLSKRVVRRTTYDLATQCESRRASMRRHTIVGCQSNFDETHSMPPSRPESRQAECVNTAMTSSAHGAINGSIQLNLNVGSRNSTGATATAAATTASDRSGNLNSRSTSSVGPWNKSFLDERTWQERGEDRLSLTLEEIVHIRSVMTKAELEGLPVGVRVKEDVEKRKVCFLCLRTRFSIFGPWGIQCKLCQRTVCSKCYTKMHLPAENFRKVPLVLISPSLLASPSGSNTPSPSHHAAHYQHAHSSSTGNIIDESFPKSLIERLLRSESERKSRASVGSAPSSPKHQRSNMSTPGGGGAGGCAAIADPASEALHDATSMTASYTAGISSGSAMANGSAMGGYINNNRVHANNKHINIMSRSMEGPRSLPANSPARTHSNSNTLDRKSKFSRAFTLSSSGNLSSDQKENVRGDLVAVCHDCKGLVMEISRSSKQTRSSERNRTLKNMHLDLSPVYK